MRLLVHKQNSQEDSSFADALVDVIPDNGSESPGVRLSPTRGLEITARNASEAVAALDALRAKQLQLMRQRSGGMIGAGQRLVDAGEAGVGTLRRGAVRFRNATVGQIGQSLQVGATGTGDAMNALILAIDLSSGIDEAIDLIGDAIGALGDILGELP